MTKKKRKFKRFPDYDCDGGCPYESPESCAVCLNRENKVIMIKKYVKKPVVIEAIQWTGKNLIDIYSFLCDKSRKEIIKEINHDFQDTRVWGNYEANIVQNGLYISTLEGKLKSDIGDYIIKGVNGEFYPCKPDIFAKTYEEVTE